MANAEQMKALIKSHSDGDDSRFYSIAMQVAAQAARQGHSKLADELRSLIDRAKEKSQSPVGRRVSHINQPRGELAGLLSVSNPRERLSSLVLPDVNYDRLKRIILEHRQKVKLEQHGLIPRRKILFFGPPGIGKTLTASALAGELHLPLFTILFDGLITKYMGETAAKLRVVFEQIDQIKGVYFFDEVDAIGTHRSSMNDVGEIRRVLNSFLQFLEQSNSESLILAATNNMSLLDKALFRRFDDVIEYNLPNEELAIKVFKNRLSAAKTKNIDWVKLANASKGLSFADICKACDDALKFIVLEDLHGELNTKLVLKCIKDRFATKQ